MNYGSLPVTGTALSIGGVILGQGTIVAIGAGLVVVGALIVKLTFRRGKSPADV